jgi:hypothetical protein
MRATKVHFERTKSLPGYNNVKVGIEIELSKGEKAIDALKKAEVFVAKGLNESPTPQQMEVALEFVQHQQTLDELPF